MKTKLKLLENDCSLRVTAKHFQYGQEVRQMWIVEMLHGRKWLPMCDPSEKDNGRHATKQEAEAALELHREALNAVNES
jgi:hypothetical protein